MAELKFKVIGDLKKLKSDMQNLFKEKLQVGVGGEGGGAGGGAGKEQKKQTGLLAQGVGLAALLVALLKTLQPVLDIIKIFISLILFGILKFIKLTLGFVPAIKKLGSRIKSFFTELPGKIKEFFINLGLKIKEFFISLPGRLKEFFINLGTRIKEFFTELPGRLSKFFSGIGSKIVNISRKFVNAIKTLALKIKTISTKLALKIKTFFKNLGIKLKTFFVNLGKKIVLLKNRVVAVLSALPGRIWDKIKELANLIAEKLKGILPRLFTSRKKNDFISRPGQAPVDFSPQDTIIGVKNPGNLGGTKVFNLYGVTPQAMIDFIKRELGTDINRSGRF